MSEFRRRWSFPFALGLGLFIACLIFLAQWQNYAPALSGLIHGPPSLSPWPFITVAALSLALAFSSVPAASAILPIISKTLTVCVFCVSTVFIVEYLSGIRIPDIGIFLPPDSSGLQLNLYSPRPSPLCAVTSLLFACALLFYDRESRWRLRAFQIGTVSALILPVLASIDYARQYFVGLRHTFGAAKGLPVPAVVLFLTLASGFFGLFRCSPQAQARVTGTGRSFRRWI